MKNLKFWGSVGLPAGRASTATPLAQWQDPPVQLYADPGAVRMNREPGPVTVILAGTPWLAGDSNFNESTAVSGADPDQLPALITQLYENDGPDSLARLEGDFAAIIIDQPNARVTFVTDKFGIRDIYVRAEGGLRFASHLELLAPSEIRLDETGVAFYLMQDFIPAPYTLLKGVRTLGRAAILEVDAATGVGVKQRRYWRPSAAWSAGAVGNPLASFPQALNETLDLLGDAEFGLLLSGGIDSSLLAAMSALRGKRFITLTGTVAGYGAGEQDLERARQVAGALGVRHRAVILDPDSPDVPELWSDSTRAWTVGSRVTLPIWLEYGRKLREELGEGFPVVTGQMADTVADNNFTISSAGYFLRRAFYSPAFFKALPRLRAVTPGPHSRTGHALTAAVRGAFGPRAAGMFRSLLGGVQTRQAWLEGRVFGFAEFPGRSSAAFPLMQPDAFNRIADWYSNSFLRPVLEDLDESNFYARLFDMSLHMVMLHLDTRVVFSAASMMGGQAFMPFLTGRMVNYFMSLPASARSWRKEPKWVIAGTQRQYRKDAKLPAPPEREFNDKPIETVLLEGSLGEYFRQLLAAPIWPSLAPGIRDMIREDYLDDQLRRLQNGAEGVDARLMIRLAALETWCRSLTGHEEVENCRRVEESGRVPILHES